MDNDPLNETRKRLIYRAWHRGTREMDLLLGTFADKNIFSFNSSEIEQFEKLLEENDPDLYDWITGKSEPPPTIANGVFKILKLHKFK